jgi:uncharacterized protein YehS (DUF1456 family)
MNILAWGKIIEASASFLEKSIDAGVQHWRTKYVTLLNVANEMMAELRNKNQTLEATTVAMQHKDSMILKQDRMLTDLRIENAKLKKLLEDRK